MEKDFLTPDENISMDDAIINANTVTPLDEPDFILPSQMTRKQKIPNKRTLSMDEAIKTYRARLDSIETSSKIARGDITTHFWGNVAKGFGDFTAELGNAPESFNAFVYRTFNGHVWPNMTEDEAIRLMDASTSYVANQERLRALIQQTEGAAGSSHGRALGAMAGQMLLIGAAGLLTGGAAIGPLAGAQAATEISQEFAETAIERNNGTLGGYNNTADTIASIAHGVISGYIEKLGVENLFANAIKRQGLTRFGSTVIKSALGEGAEEFLQETSKFLFENVVGKSNRTLGQYLNDALVNAEFGVIGGSVYGGLMYYPNRMRIQKALKARGLTDAEAAAITDDMIDSAKTSMLSEIDTRSQIREHYGEQWASLKDKIVTALTNAGWKETNPNVNLEKYAEDNADDIVRPLFRFSNKYGVDTRDLIQLADIEVIDNALYLRPGELGTPEQISARIKEKQDEIKRQTMLARTGAGDPGLKQSLQTQVELLQKYYERQTGARYSAARRTRVGKARADAEILVNTEPAVAETIANIDTTQMTTGQPTTQIRERMDGNPFVYVGTKQLPVEYKVVPMSEVIASHIGQEVNPRYSLKELQNRAQRGSRTDVSILQSRAAKIQPENLGISYNTQNGAPIVNERGEVIAGNGRFEVIRMTDDAGRARYNKYLESLGLDLNGIENPVLVRVLHGLNAEQQIAVADASNVSATSAFDNASQAVQDAKLLAGTNGITDFLNKIPIESRQGLFLANDRVNKVALERRYNDALMMWLLNNDTQLYEDLYLMGGITQKIQTALYQAIPGMMSLESQYPDVGIRADLAEALKKLPSVARSNDFAFTISQSSIEDSGTNLFNQNALLYALVFGKNTKTWEGSGPDRLQVGLTLSEFFDTYTRAATQNQENIGKTDLFGQPLAIERTRGDILAETLTLAFPREFEDGTARSRNMRAVFLTRAQTEPGPTQFSQIDLHDQVQPTLFPDDTSTASAVKNLPWERPVDVIQPIFFNRKPDARDIEAARTQGYDSFLILDKTDTPTQLVLLDGTTVNLRKGAKIPTGAELYKAQPTQLLQQDMAVENALLDDIYPEYKGETINIDGVERTVYNSNGDRIAKSEPALRNFYKWFGDSKVVDKKGRPLVVYHGARGKTDITEFDPKKGWNVDATYFASNPSAAAHWSVVSSETKRVFDLDSFTKKIKSTNSVEKLLEYYRVFRPEAHLAQEYNRFENENWWWFHKTNDDVGIPLEAEINEKEFVDRLQKDILYYAKGSIESDLYGVYVKLQKPLIVDAKKKSYHNILFNGDRVNTETIVDYAQANNYDGVIVKNVYETDFESALTDDIIAFKSTQIKSVDNRGTFSEDTGNIYFQSAYAGSRVDYDRPSLEAIGSGEGNQAHGWGLYYALNPEIAERYRKSFLTGDSLYESYSYNGGNLSYIEDTVVADIAEKVINTKKTKQEIIKDKIAEIEKDIKINKKGLETAESEDAKSFRREQIEDSEAALQFLNKLNPDDIVIKSGQVHEVDIPEMDVLLDEQKTFAEQSDFVKEQLAKIGSKYLFDMTKLSESEKITEASRIMKDWTGGQIYRALAEYHQSDKDASQMLEKYGIKGITYDGRQDGRCFVIFNPESVKVLRKKFDELGNQLFQKRRPNGFYDPELEVIVLGRNSNTGTLPHEMAHFWANTIFNLVKSGQYNNNPDFMAQAMGMFKMLGVGMNQQTLTRDQQEQFATMTEAVIFGMAPVPQGTELPIIAFLNWVPAKYKSILDIGYRNAEGRVVNPILDKAAVDWFNAWYGNGTLPAIDASPLDVENSNGQTGDRILPSSVEVMKVRAAEITTEADRLRVAREEQTREAEAATPASERAAAAGAEAQIESEPGNIERSTPPAAKKRSIVSTLIPGRGTNTREGMFAAAREYIAKDRVHAEEVAFGSPAEVMNDTGVDRAILIRALMEEYSRGDAEYGALYHNLAETVSLAGKTPGLSNDMNFQYYLEALKRITNGMEGIAAIKYAGTRNLNKARRTFNSDIDAFIQERANEILRAGPDTQMREAMIKKMFAEAAVKFGGQDAAMQFNQEDLRRARSLKSTDRALFTEWANREVRKMLKASPDTDTINQIMEISEKAEKARKFLDSNDLAEAEAAGKAIREWQMFVKEKEVPDTWLSRLIGSWYPKAMLYNINTHSVNLTGNTFNYGIVKTAVAIQYKQGNKVSDTALTAERERLHRLYDSSLINLAAMSNPTSPTLLKGEQYNPREGKSTIGKVADFSMDLLGKEDAIFRIRAYLDALGHIATADAAKTGGDPTALFNEYKKINQPKDSRAYAARQEALHISDLAVFQQTGVLSEGLKKVRDALNFGQRAGLGTLLGPFVKTPANIVEQGARAIAAPLTAGYHAVKGEWSIRDTMDSGYFVLACILTMGLMGDYEPPYQVPMPYDPNKPYDSVRIRGTNTWIKLDTFASASVPMRIIASIATGKGLGLAGAANEVPLIGDLADAYGEAARIEGDPYKQGIRFGANWAYNRVNTAVPAILKYTLAAMHPADLRLDEIDVGLPKTGIGRKIGRQYGLAGGDTTTNDILRIFFNRLRIYDK